MVRVDTQGFVAFRPGGSLSKPVITWLLPLPGELERASVTVRMHDSSLHHDSKRGYGGFSIYSIVLRGQLHTAESRSADSQVLPPDCPADLLNHSILG